MDPVDVYKHGYDVQKVSVMVEVLAKNADDAVHLVDRLLITDAVVNNPWFVSFSIVTPAKTREINP